MSVVFGQIIYLGFAALMIAAAAFDVATMTIPNRLSLALAGLFAIAAVYAGLSPAEILTHGAVGLAVLLICFGLFAAGALGGGDAKLLAAASLWFGWPALIPFLAVTALAGGVLAVAIMTFRSSMLPAFTLRYDWMLRLHDKKIGMPYGVAIAVGALFTFSATDWTALPAG